MTMSMCSIKYCPPPGLGLKARARAVVRCGAVPPRQSGMARAVEVVCVVSSAALSVGFAARGGERLLAAAMLATAAAVGMGAWGRQLKGSVEERVESVEAEVRETAAAVRAMQRQVEKLSIRFRLTRRALKDPIAQTAGLAEKNWEATRALAMQEDALEKEVRELQRVLEAMQEQQQKQLDLILAVAKTANLFRSHSHNLH